MVRSSVCAPFLFSGKNNECKQINFKKKRGIYYGLLLYEHSRKRKCKRFKKHFDGEIDNAISRGCTTFVTGKHYPEDELFAERVLVAAKEYTNKNISLIFADPELKSDEDLKKYFVDIADWEIYSYYVEY